MVSALPLEDPQGVEQVSLLFSVVAGFGQLQGLLEVKQCVRGSFFPQTGDSSHAFQGLQLTAIISQLFSNLPRFFPRLQSFVELCLFFVDLGHTAPRHGFVLAVSEFGKYGGVF